jgi:hypothetical protein
MPEQTPILDALETSAIINRKDKPGQVPWTEWRVPVVTASGGPPSEGSIPMLDASGQIDSSMIPGGGTVGPNLQVALVAGMNINAFQAISIHSDGKAYLADAGTAGDAGKVIGVAITSALAGNAITVCLDGEIDNLGFLFNPGDEIFLGLSGALVNTPGNGVFEQPLGIAASSSRLMLEVGLPIALA